MSPSTLTEEVAVEVPAPFIDLFYPHRYKAFHGGRGSAKSHSFAKALISQAYNADKMHKLVHLVSVVCLTD